MHLIPKKEVIINPDTMEHVPPEGITIERDSDHYLYWMKMLEWGDVEIKTGGDTEAN